MNNGALRYAIQKGRVAVLIELRIGYGLTSNDVRTLNNLIIYADSLEELRNGYKIEI